MWIADLFSIRTSHQTQYESIVAEYKTAIEGNEKIVARLRSQRDQMQVELNERKLRDGNKFTSVAELRTLAESRGVSVVLHRMVLLSARAYV